MNGQTLANIGRWIAKSSTSNREPAAPSHSGGACQRQLLSHTGDGFRFGTILRKKAMQGEITSGTFVCRCCTLKVINCFASGFCPSAVVGVSYKNKIFHLFSWAENFPVDQLYLIPSVQIHIHSQVPAWRSSRLHTSVSHPHFSRYACITKQIQWRPRNTTASTIWSYLGLLVSFEKPEEQDGGKQQLTEHRLHRKIHS